MNLKNREIQEFIRILIMLMIFKNKKNRYREKTNRMEIFDANVLIQLGLVIGENSIAVSAEPTLAC